MKTLFKAGNEGKVLGGELEMKGMRRPYQHTKITNKRYSNGRKEVGEEKDKEEEEAIVFSPLGSAALVMISMIVICNHLRIANAVKLS